MGKIIVASIVTYIFSFVSNSAVAAVDTSGIIHSTDGLTGEWPAEKFSANGETGIRFAIDNDATTLFVSMKINDRMEQRKIIQMGMRLFIDLKGKHKQNLGIEFPITQDIQSDYEGVRLMLTVSPKMKLFGFQTDVTSEQNINDEGNVNLAFAWDSTNTMNIEWLIPLRMLEQDIVSLDHKLISIGWKINGVDMPVTSSTPVSTSLGGHPNNGISKPGKKPANDPIPADMERMMKEQDIWTKHTIRF